MHWISVILLGLAGNLDNLGIGLSLGMQSMRLPFISNVIISAISMVAVFFALSIGAYIAHFVPLEIANGLGGVLLIGLGAWTIRSIGSDMVEESAKADADHNRVISPKESIVLGFALALNNVASGLGAGIIGVSPLWTMVSTGFFSMLTLYIGVHWGLKIAGTWIGKNANMISGMLLVAIGFYEMLV